MQKLSEDNRLKREGKELLGCLAFSVAGIPLCSAVVLGFASAAAGAIMLVGNGMGIRPDTLPSSAGLFAWGSTALTAAYATFRAASSGTKKGLLLASTLWCGCCAMVYTGFKQGTTNTEERIHWQVKKAAYTLTTIKENHPDYAKLQQEIATAPERIQQSNQVLARNKPFLVGSTAATFLLSAGTLYYCRRRKKADLEHTRD